MKNFTEKLEPTGNTIYRRFLESFLIDFSSDNKVELSAAVLAAVAATT